MGATMDDSPYPYDPSFVSAIIGAAAYSLVCGMLLFQFFKYKAWMLWVLMIGALMDAVGFITRAISAHDVHLTYAYLVSYLTILLAPSFIAAACYMTFGRLVWWITPSNKRSFRVLWCPPRWITPIFVLFDLFSFLIQLFGGGRVASATLDDSMSPKEKSDTLEQGYNILKLGLGLQLACFGIFAFIGIRFLFISKSWDRGAAKFEGIKWQRLNWVINIGATLIMLRAIYRFVEFTETEKGYLQTHEWVFWIFDAWPICICLTLFAVLPPGTYLPYEFTRFRINKKKLMQQPNPITSPPPYVGTQTYAPLSAPPPQDPRFEDMELGYVRR